MSKWKNTNLRGKINIKHGFPFKSEFFADDGNYIVLTPGNFFEAGGFKRQLGKEKFYQGEITEGYIYKKGDLIVAMTEQAEGLLGSCAIVPDDNLYLHNQRLGLITVNDYEVDKMFIYHLFKTKNIRQQLRLTSSGSKVKHTSPERIYDLKVYLPPLKTQDKIASILSTLDAKIELNNRINAELEAIAKTLYDYWFVQFDFPDENGKPYKSSGGKMVYNEILKREIPKSWEVESVNNLLEVKDGTHDSPKKSNTGQYLITSKHIEQNGINFKEAYLISEKDFKSVNKRSKVDEGDFLVSMIGTVGLSYWVKEIDRPFAIKNIGLFKTSHVPHLADYICLTINSSFGTAYLRSRISFGTSQPYVTLGSLREFPIIVPSKDILNYFKERIEPINQTIHTFHKENQQLTQLRDWLLPMLMNGQVKIK